MSRYNYYIAFAALCCFLSETACRSRSTTGSSAADAERIVPEAPKDVKATLTDKQTLTLRWKEVEGASSYNVYWTIGDKLQLGDAHTESRLLSPTFKHTNLDSTKTYTYAVSALGKGGESKLSKTLSFDYSKVSGDAFRKKELGPIVALAADESLLQVYLIEQNCSAKNACVKMLSRASINDGFSEATNIYNLSTDSGYMQTSPNGWTVFVTDLAGLIRLDFDGSTWIPTTVIERKSMTQLQMSDDLTVAAWIEKGAIFVAEQVAGVYESPKKVATGDALSLSRDGQYMVYEKLGIRLGERKDKGQWEETNLGPGRLPQRADITGTVTAFNDAGALLTYKKKTFTWASTEGSYMDCCRDHNTLSRDGVWLFSGKSLLKVAVKGWTWRQSLKEEPLLARFNKDASRILFATDKQIFETSLKNESWTKPKSIY